MKDPLNREKTAYEVLNAVLIDNVKTIREKYMELIKKYPERAEELHEAFRILKNPEERLKIDFFYYL